MKTQSWQVTYVLHVFPEWLSRDETQEEPGVWCLAQWHMDQWGRGSIFMFSILTALWLLDSYLHTYYFYTRWKYFFPTDRAKCSSCTHTHSWFTFAMSCLTRVTGRGRFTTSPEKWRGLLPVGPTVSLWSTHADHIPRLYLEKTFDVRLFESLSFHELLNKQKLLLLFDVCEKVRRTKIFESHILVLSLVMSACWPLTGS